MLNPDDVPGPSPPPLLPSFSQPAFSQPAFSQPSPGTPPLQPFPRPPSSLSNITAFYTKLLHRDPVTMRAVEALLRSVSYLSSGRAHPQTSDLFYMCSNLLQYVNDRILCTTGTDDICTIASDVQCTKLQSMLHVLQCVEGFVELSALRAGGQVMKWAVIVAVSVCKSVVRLVLLFRYGKVLQGAGNDVNKCDKPSGWVGGKTGIFFKTVNASELRVIPSRQQVYAEVAYIARPIVHLVSLACFRGSSWLPLILTLATELYSLRTLVEVKGLSERQQLELERRRSALLLYGLRSPCYNAVTERCVSTVLSLVERVPVVNMIAENVLGYLPEWQSIYFYTWPS